MATHSNATTKKLKTGMRVNLNGVPRWATVNSEGDVELHDSREDARQWRDFVPNDQCRIVRLNPITGVVSK